MCLIEMGDTGIFLASCPFSLTETKVHFYGGCEASYAWLPLLHYDHRLLNRECIVVVGCEEICLLEVFSLSVSSDLGDYNFDVLFEGSKAFRFVARSRTDLCCSHVQFLLE
jgi:hypothetical protein